MCKYCTTNNYRKIFINHHGPIPVEPDGRIYDIHHIDGNRSNNDPTNLKAVTLQEHFDIHYQQGDYRACNALAMRMALSPEMISYLATQAAKMRVAQGGHPFLRENFSRDVQLKRVAEGTHHMVGGEVQRRLIAEGKNPFTDPEFSRKHQLARIEAGTHNLVGANNHVHNLVAQGIHPWQDKAAARARAQRMVKEGKHGFVSQNPNTIQLTCPHCDMTGAKPGMSRWHFDKCKYKK